MIFKKYIYLTFLIFCLFSCKNEIFTPPNIIFILTDDQGYGDLGVYGADDILTPNIDFLASQGARLTSYYATQPVCSASRASILTGSYSDRISIYGAFMPNSKKGINSELIIDKYGDHCGNNLMPHHTSKMVNFFSTTLKSKYEN